MAYEYYGTLSEANAYFATKLHTTAWDNSNDALRLKALYEATRLIDNLRFKGYKSTVYALIDTETNTTDATDEELYTANLAQQLEFPRNSDIIVPEDIRIACYEIAYCLLDGSDPVMDLENLVVTQHQYANVKTQYDRNQNPPLHTLSMIPSPYAFNLLLPYIATSRRVDLYRIN